jgi:hypothetical protein
MVKKTDFSESTSSSQVRPNGDSAVPKPSEIANLLVKADELLEAGEPKKALDLLARSKIQSPWVTNAMAVCQLRLGNAKSAVDMLRGLVLGAGGIHMREDVPAVFKTNFAVALLKAGNTAGCLSALADVRVEHAAVGRIASAIEKFKKSLTLWEKLNWYMGVPPDRPVALDFPPGDLE